MTESETIVKSVVDWADQKKTDRWLLCVAATAQGWLPEQEDDAQDFLSEAEYDKAIADARAAYETAKREYGREKVRTIIHDSLYIGFIVRRYSSVEMSKLQDEIEKRTAKDGGQYISNCFRSVVQYPEASHLDRLRDIVGAAALVTFPTKWIASLGAEGERRAKKR